MLKGFLKGLIWGMFGIVAIALVATFYAPLPGPDTAEVETPAGTGFDRALPDPDLVTPVSGDDLPAAATPSGPRAQTPRPDATPDTSPAAVALPAQQVARLEAPQTEGPSGFARPASEGAPSLPATAPAAEEVPAPAVAPELATDPAPQPARDPAAIGPPPSLPGPDGGTVAVLSAPPSAPAAPRAPGADRPIRGGEPPRAPLAAPEPVAPEPAAPEPVDPAPAAGPRTLETASLAGSRAAEPPRPRATPPASIPDPESGLLPVTSDETALVPATEEVAVLEPSPNAAPQVLGPAPDAPDTAPGPVLLGRLPSIAAPNVPQVSVEAFPEAPVVESIQGALARNALSMSLDPGLPLFSIVLIDRTGNGLPLAEIAGLPVPVTVAMDPGVEGAASAAEGYNATGHEVMVLAEDLPLDGNAADLSVALNGLLARIPVAVGVLLPPGSEIARNRAAMDQIAAILARTGHGLAFVPEGLDAAGQAAEAAEVPAAPIFRVLDGKDEGVPLMTRYMDRAAFEAAREQSVVVLGTVQPGTIEAIQQWVARRRAATVAVAPISTIMLQ